ncbi:MAG: protein kinase [Planctomycetia bacterium]|nr:protein kinase [Planctomycetia bacterium]
MTSHNNNKKRDLPEDSSWRKQDFERPSEEYLDVNSQETVFSSREAFPSEDSSLLNLPMSVPFARPSLYPSEETPLCVETVLRGEIFEGVPVSELTKKYSDLTASKDLNFSEHIQLERLLGEGGQGMVFFSRRQGMDGFNVPVAFKFFSPSPFSSEEKYILSMENHAKVATIVNQIQQENLLNVYNWRQLDGIRVMEMEWVDGFDLQQLMTYHMYDWLQSNLGSKDFDILKNVVVTEGKTRPRLKSGIVIKIIRDCLMALTSLHDNKIVHSDIKCSNIMLKRTGNAKIIDFGGAYITNEKFLPEAYTPAYAAPELIDPHGNGWGTAQSDLASLGYVMIELLAGCSLFADVPQDGQYINNLLMAKRNLIHRLPGILPHDVLQDKLLVDFCKKLIEPDMSKRFETARDAILSMGGLAEVQRQLIRGGMVSEFDFDICGWIRSLENWVPPRKKFRKPKL